MRAAIEQVVVHNPILGATALWSFSSAYHGIVNQMASPSLPEMMLVLPITYHRRSAKSLHRMMSTSGLSRAIREDPELPVGLQARLEGFADTSLDSLAVAVATGLLEVDPDKPWPRYVPGRKSLPNSARSSSSDSKMIVGAARRLGWWLAHESLLSTLAYLQVRF